MNKCPKKNRPQMDTNGQNGKIEEEWENANNWEFKS